MAYRRMDAQAITPSFLDDYLEEIQSLPSQVKAKYTELRELDDSVVAYMADASAAASEAVRRALGKSTESNGGTNGSTQTTSGGAGGGGATDPLRKTFQELISCQTKAGECASRKIELAKASYTLVEDAIKSLDDKLKEYEAQLKKEGRWPSTDKNENTHPRRISSSSNRTNNAAEQSRNEGSGGGHRKDSTGLSASRSNDDESNGAGTSGLQNTKASVSTPSPNPDPVGTSGGGGGGGGGSTTTKSRKRDRERARSDRAESSTKRQKDSSERGSQKARLPKEKVVENPDPKNMVVIEDMQIDPDEPRYCICNQVSYGEMVACEGKNCVHEWFHYSCVGLTSAPKGQWFCPSCKQKRKKKS